MIEDRSGQVTSFGEFLDLLQGELEVFRFLALDLRASYGEDYEKHALFFLGKLAEFAGVHGESLTDALSFYVRHIAQVVEDRRLFLAGTKPQNRWSDLQYLYALTLSTALNRSRYELFLDYRRALSEHLPRGSAILEIGAGNCMDAHFASSYGKVRAYERNELSRSWQRLLDLEGPVDLRIEEYRFDEPEAFDHVTMIELLEHVENPATYLAHAWHALKDGGLAYLTFALRMPQVDHLYDFTSVEECHDMLAEAGFVFLHENCLIDTFKPFDESERWLLAEDPDQAAIYCCLVRKEQSQDLTKWLEGFNASLS